MKLFSIVTSLALALLLSGCAKTNSGADKQDYSAFRESKPRSILVLMPKNDSPDVSAGYGFISEVTFPLAEAGYYVFPVAVVEETFKHNGVTHANDINSVSLAKLHSIFGADAVLYLTVTDYGTSYQVIDSETRVAAKARLVDVRSGKELWTGSASASSNEKKGYNNNNSLLGTLIAAAVNQISDTVFDKAHDVAAITSTRLLAAGTGSGMLYGPRSPEYAKQGL
ncbi:DUF799 domain-containing protein [Dryocola clanedunensis]